MEKIYKTFPNDLYIFNGHNSLKKSDALYYRDPSICIIKTYANNSTREKWKYTTVRLSCYM